YKGREDCNDFSIGIELEGTDTGSFTAMQYQVLARICQALMVHYGIDREDIQGHSDVAPGRKTDPGKEFEWEYLYNLIREEGLSGKSTN
ncbi:MAG: N-acetylmuramoyl-L-alanine amidase, partial [Gammaproteobacteria bacterium]|nr:N-acetylmuramoyl-L-alanine amidase [Gammaproteobacteria bacterium]